MSALLALAQPVYFFGYFKTFLTAASPPPKKK
jgi:hypothetical protein